MSEEVPENSQELSLVCTNDILFSDPGDDVVLSCHLNPAISAVSMEIKWWNKEDLVCHYKNGQVTVKCEGRVSFSWQDLLNGNVSLTLRDVRITQKGQYICEVIHESRTIKEYIFLRISSEDFSLVVPDGIVSADPGGDVILPVHLSPETSAVSMKIKWLRGTELIYQYKNRQEETNNENQVSLSIQELERGNLSLTLRNVQHSDSGKYTCKIIHDGCEKTGVVHLQVRELPDSQPDSQRQTQTDETTFKRTQKFGGKKRKYNVEESSMLEKLYFFHILSSSFMDTPDTLYGPTPTPRNSPRLSDDVTLERPIPLEPSANVSDDRLMIAMPIEPACSRAPPTSWECAPPVTNPYVSPAIIPTFEIPSYHEGASFETWEYSTELGCQESLLSAFEQENPGATRTQEQERFFPAVQSQVQDREEISQSVTAGDMTQTPERPEDRMQ